MRRCLKAVFQSSQGVNYLNLEIIKIIIASINFSFVKSGKLLDFLFELS